MARSKCQLKQVTKSSCITSLEILSSLVLKLLDSADVSDKASKSLYLFLEKRAMKYAKDCESLRIEREKLLKERETLYGRLDHVEKQNRQLGEEGQRLQRQLEVIREVLRDNDIDKAKERLVQLEECGWMRSPTPSRCVNGRIDHSAGSLLDSENASSGDSDVELKSPKASAGRKRSHPIGGILRRSARLSAGKNLKPSSPNDHPAFSSTKSVISRKRISSDSASSYHDIAFKRIAFDEAKLESDGVTEDPSSFRTPVRPTTTGNRLTRLHQFVSISSLRLQMCGCCGKRFALGRPALRCKICRLVVHENCQNRLKQRCVPPTDIPSSPNRAGEPPLTPLSTALSRRCLGASIISASPAVGTPSSASKHRVFSWHSVPLASLCPPNEFPKIPAPVIHCVNEVAARGLLQVGIYRVPGAEKKVFELLDKFMHGRTTPSLALVEDINVVCSCLKAFLRLLSEPLVTYSLRPEFIESAELSLRDSEGAKHRVATLMDKLPIANRDTLAFIILHLKAVSRSSTCRMGEMNLAKVFGYTLVGHSCPEPSLTQAANEVNGQQSVVRLLLSVPDLVYSTILD
ncbi:Rac GTPase activating protein 1 [Echinococcus multilocularis]|uniref:Rac GTPase activating protein 1 n=1 Tax=Echinococcus multilocularis TaxID=6211 RepID=A0A068Y9T5_ECHMU|nr:Rac GTPase activating protein 1 [Echinococcus multilocularis]